MAKRSTGKGRRQSKTSAVRMAKGDIVRLILEDHRPLKRLIRILKSDSRSLTERQRAFEEFVPLLIAHSKPEEETVYSTMKDTEKLRQTGYHGDVEHGIADQMTIEAQRTGDLELWCAKVKVLAEIVEHHLQEEEEHHLPVFKKFCNSDERVELGDRYRELRARLLAQGDVDAVQEAIIRKSAEYVQLRH